MEKAKVIRGPGSVEKSSAHGKEGSSVMHRVWTVIGAVLCVILIPILAVNLTLIVRSYTQSDQVPSVGGYLPLIVLTDSMYPNIQSGDLIICHTAEPSQVAVGDVIAFFDPASGGSSVVTHRVAEVTTTEAGTLGFITKGDANNTEDADIVPAENLVGVYRSRIPGAGNVAMFFQTTTGLIVCVVIPLVLLVGYDVVRRRIYERGRREDTAALMEELEALRARSAGEETSPKG